MAKEQLAAHIRALLRLSAPRHFHALIARLAVEVADGTPHIVTQNSGDYVAVQPLLPQIRVLIREAGWPAPCRCVVRSLASEPAPPDGARAAPPWIAPARWATLPPLLRAAFHGATLCDGALHAATDGAARVLARYSDVVRALVAEASD